MKAILITTLLIVLIFLGCNDSQKEKSPILAKIDEREINIEEFRSFYNFDVNFGLDSSGIDALEDELFFYMDQINALKKARENGLIRDRIFIKAYEWEKRQAMLRQLYRIKITENIAVSEKELRDLYRNQQTEIRFKHLFYKAVADAEQAYNNLLAGSSFEELASTTFGDDSLAKTGGYIDWIKMSDLDEVFASSVSTLSINTISRPLNSKWGFHIVEVLDKRINPIITESEFNRFRPSLFKKIKSQKSQALSADYIKSYIGKLNPQLDPVLFKKFWSMVIPPNEKESVKLNRKMEITQSVIDKVRLLMKNELKSPLINYNTGLILLGDFLSGLEKIPVSHVITFQTKHDLSNQIGKWIRDELLIEEALKEGLDEDSRVLNETSRFMEEQSYYYYQSLVSDTMHIPAKVLDYYSPENSLTKNLNPSLARFHTLQEWKFEYSKKLLHEDLKKMNPTIIIDKKILQQENENVNWDNKIRMFMIRKPS